MLESFLLLGLLLATSCAYVLRVLLFEEAGTGPFMSREAFVTIDGVVVRPVHFFDRIRRLFGAYRVSVDPDIQKWEVFPSRMLLWMCPKCLSFWIAMPYSVLLASVMGAENLRYGLLWPIVHFSVAYVAQALVFLNLRLEGE